MDYNLPGDVLSDIISIAEKNNIQKIILFGSRARKDNSDRSDIDIAVTGGDVDSFYWDINEDVWSLLSFDIVELDKCSAELISEIDRDGVTIYEKNR
jgi:predicted nucleotidyltransferase